MNVITDFYQFKYSRDSLYRFIYKSKSSLIIEQALDEIYLVFIQLKMSNVHI